MIECGSKLLKECFVVFFRGAVLHNNGLFVVGYLVDYKRGFVYSPLVEKVLECTKTLIRNIDAGYGKTFESKYRSPGN